MKLIKPVYILMLLVPLIWSSNFVLGKILVQYLPPFTITTSRFVISLVILLVILKIKGLLKWPEKDLLIKITLLGLSGIFGFNTILYIGLKYTTAVNSTIINAFNPVVVAVMSTLWLQEKQTSRQMGGFLLSFLGILFIAVKGSWQVMLSLGFNLGDIIIFFDTIVWAFFTILSRKVMSRISPLETTAYANFAGVFFLIPATLYEWGGGVPTINPGHCLMLLYLGIFASVLAFLWWNKGVAEIGPTRAAAFYNLIPVYAAVLAYFILGEQLYLYHLIGGLMVLSGVYLGIKKKYLLNNAGTGQAGS
jgi:drug/metabolite transporter (DMT)-like permease